MLLQPAYQTTCTYAEVELGTFSNQLIGFCWLHIFHVSIHTPAYIYAHTHTLLADKLIYSRV